MGVNKNESCPLAISFRVPISNAKAIFSPNDLFNPSLNPFGLCMSFTDSSGDALTLSGNGKSNPVVL